MSDETDELLREIGRAVVEQTTGMPGPDGYLLDPAPTVEPSEGNFTCPACAGVHPEKGGGGHGEGCPLAAYLARRGGA